MTTTPTSTTSSSAGTSAHDHTVLGCLARSVPAAVGASLTVWAVSRIGDVDLVVRSGQGTQTIGWASVLVASAVATAAGTVVLAVLRRRLRRGRSVGLWLATALFLVSLVLGPLNATTITAALVLGAMHAIVWGVVTAPVRRRRSILASR